MTPSNFSFGRMVIAFIMFGIMLTLGEISGKLERIAYALEQKH